MAKHYSPSTKGFYDMTIHGDKMPEDVVEISDDEWRALLEANSRGRIIDTGSDGKPVARDLNDVELSVGRKAARNQMLSDTDWLVARHRDELDEGESSLMAAREEDHTTLTDAQYKALQAYRSRLRAITEHEDWPRVSFPVKPQGI